MKTPSITIEGNIHQIGETEARGTSGFRVRNLWLLYVDTFQRDGQNVEKVNTPGFEFHGDKCDELDSFAEGDKVSITFNLQGREWTNKSGEKVVFNSNKAWKIEMIEQAQPAMGHILEEEEEAEGLPF